MRDTSSVLPSVEMDHQEPFERVVPLLKGALLLGAGGSLLAMVLILVNALPLPLNIWWSALTQVNNHIQLYGWASLFVIGIVLYFLPRLRGAPLIASWLLPWIVRGEVSALFLRALSQPLLVLTSNVFWRLLLVVSGVLECVAFGIAALLLVLLIWKGPPLANKRAFRGILPFLGGAFASLVLASLVNLGNVVLAAQDIGLVQGDNLNITLVSLGFLVPLVLALSVRSLPVYAGLPSFPTQLLWPLSTAYFIGLALTFIGMSWAVSFPWLSVLSGIGMILLATVLLIFICVFLYLMRSRGQLPAHITQFASSLYTSVAQSYQGKANVERNMYGPFVLLIASSYVWAALGVVLLTFVGVASLLGTTAFFPLDAMGHCFTFGFITLLLAGISVRMLPGFSGQKTTGPGWVTALFWLGNVAAFLDIGSQLFLPVLVAWGNIGLTIYTILFVSSGTVSLAFAVCLALNLWPTLQIPMHG